LMSSFETLAAAVSPREGLNGNKNKRSIDENSSKISEVIQLKRHKAESSDKDSVEESGTDSHQAQKDGKLRVKVDKKLTTCEICSVSCASIKQLEQHKRGKKHMHMVWCLENNEIPPGHPIGSWKCIQCKNINWPQRHFCNRCELKRQSDASTIRTSPQLQQGLATSAMMVPHQLAQHTYNPAPRFGATYVGGNGMFSSSPFSHANMLQQGNPVSLTRPAASTSGAFDSRLSEHPEGSWECMECNNINWPRRTSCNRCEASRETAEKPRSASTVPPQRREFGNFPPHGSQSMQGYSVSQGHPMSAPVRTDGNRLSEHPEGSWECIECKNINWPRRTSCNRCEASRETAENPKSVLTAPPQRRGSGGDFFQPDNMPMQGYSVSQGNPAMSAPAMVPPQLIEPMAPRQLVQQLYGAEPGYGGGYVGGNGMNNVPSLQYPNMLMQGNMVSPSSASASANNVSNRLSEHPEGSWECVKCANINWPRRTSCNRCEASRETAEKPNSVSVPTHGSGGNFLPHGNMSMQGYPVSQGNPAMSAPAMVPPQLIQQVAQSQIVQTYGAESGYGGGYVGGNDMNNAPSLPYPNMLIQGNMVSPSSASASANNVSHRLSEHPEGSWECVKCANINWPRRTSCNRCEASRETAEKPDSVPAMTRQHRASGGNFFPHGNMPIRGFPISQGDPTVSTVGTNGNRLSEHPEGSWECIECKNINWPRRTSCNRCEASRGIVVPPQQQLKHQQPHGIADGAHGGLVQTEAAAHPAGSWRCIECKNVNWPRRTSCNRCKAAVETSGEPLL